MKTTLATAAFLIASLQPGLPTGPLAMRDFRLQFDPAGTFKLTGEGWPAMSGRWTISGSDITLQNDPGPSKCDGAATYRFNVDGATVGLDVIADDCKVRHDDSRSQQVASAWQRDRRTRATHCAHGGNREDTASSRESRLGRLAVVPRPRSLRRQ